MDSKSAVATSETSHTLVIDWRMLVRIVLKAGLLFAAINITFALIRPTEWLGRLSLYNTLIPGRERLPYGEVPAVDYNLTLNNLPAMFASQRLNQTKPDSEFRVLIIGDSGVWGWLLDNEETLAGQLNQMDLLTKDGRRVVAYNLGYPVMSLTKDLMILDEAMSFGPDLIVWPMTLQSFARNRQFDHPLLQNNAARVRRLIKRGDLQLNPTDDRFIDRSFVEETIVGRRRDLADLIRLQALGLAWAATGIDQDIPTEITLRSNDLRDDLSWLDISEPRSFTEQDLTFDVLAAGIGAAGKIPVLIVNEPMFVSDGENSDIRYNTFYPRWAYDQYRQKLADIAVDNGWNYVDLWDTIPPKEFTDTPVHLTPAGSRLLAEKLAPYLVNN